MKEQGWLWFPSNWNGFALGGVFYGHVFLWFSPNTFCKEKHPKAIRGTFLDRNLWNPHPNDCRIGVHHYFSGSQQWPCALVEKGRKIFASGSCSARLFYWFVECFCGVKALDLEWSLRWFFHFFPCFPPVQSFQNTLEWREIIHWCTPIADAFDFWITESKGHRRTLCPTGGISSCCTSRWWWLPTTSITKIPQGRCVCDLLETVFHFPAWSFFKSWDDTQTLQTIEVLRLPRWLCRCSRFSHWLPTPRLLILSGCAWDLSQEREPPNWWVKSTDRLSATVTSKCETEKPETENPCLSVCQDRCQRMRKAPVSLSVCFASFSSLAARPFVKFFCQLCVPSWATSKRCWEWVRMGKNREHHLQSKSYHETISLFHPEFRCGVLLCNRHVCHCLMMVCQGLAVVGALLVAVWHSKKHRIMN